MNKKYITLDSYSEFLYFVFELDETYPESYKYPLTEVSNMSQIYRLKLRESDPEIGIRLSPDLLEDANDRAEAYGQNVETYINQVLARALENYHNEAAESAMLEAVFQNVEHPLLSQLGVTKENKNKRKREKVVA